MTTADSTLTNFEIYLDDEDINLLKFYNIGFMLKYSI